MNNSIIIFNDNPRGYYLNNIKFTPEQFHMMENMRDKEKIRKKCTIVKIGDMWCVKEKEKIIDPKYYDDIENAIKDRLQKTKEYEDTIKNNK